MPLRQNPRTKRWENVELAGPNPTCAPPVDRGFTYHLDVISNRVGRKHRPYWMQKYKCWGIQALNDAGQWQTVFMAYDEMTAHKGNEHPYMPLDTRIIDEFANVCLEIRYNTGDIEKDRLMREADAAYAAAVAEQAEDARQIEHIAGVFTKALAGTDEGDHKRAAKALRYSHTAITDGTGFKEFHQVPRGEEAG